MTFVPMDWCKEEEEEERRRSVGLGAELHMYANGSLRRVTCGMLQPSTDYYDTTLQFTTHNVYHQRGEGVKANADPASIDPFRPGSFRGWLPELIDYWLAELLAIVPAVSPSMVF